MIRISLAAAFIYLSALAGFSQSISDSSAYGDRKLKLEEVNFISSYYKQDGNNSAVTGGIGSEKLTDFATTIDIRLSRYDHFQRKHTISGEIGIDVYTSASSDKIDPSTISSASSQDVRVYPSLTYAITNEDKRATASGTASVSTEYDYFSAGLGAGWSKLSKDRNREFSVTGQMFLDTWSVILPIELRSSTNITGTKPRNSYSASFTLSQVLTRRLQMLLLSDFAFQQGQLATLYHRAYFNDMTHKVENLPDKRFKIPIGVRLNYFIGDRYIVKMYYRYYQDSWGMNAHTAETEVPIKITPFLSVSPFYRYYKQDEVKYFKAYGQHNVNEEFYTSDFDLSKLTSNLFGTGIRYAPPGGVAGFSRLNALELRYGHYERSTGLNANIITLLAKFK
ncbi:MAG: DUF3570 domain-containing protein [Cyclobacteriaceae bacterium]